LAGYITTRKTESSGLCLTKPEVQIVANADALYQAAAAQFVRQAGSAVEAKGACTVALSGGSTPKGLYGLLADNPTRHGQGTLGQDARLLGR
jgi:hypothetical protein